MTNRVIYPEAALWGATPSLIDRYGPAARDIAAIADEVDGILGFRRAAVSMNKTQAPQGDLADADDDPRRPPRWNRLALTRRTTTNELAGARPAASAPAIPVIEMEPKPEPLRRPGWRSLDASGTCRPSGSPRQGGDQCLQSSTGMPSMRPPGIIPLPALNVASFTAIIVRMVRTLSAILRCAVRALTVPAPSCCAGGGEHAHRPRRRSRPQPSSTSCRAAP